MDTPPYTRRDDMSETETTDEAAKELEICQFLEDMEWFLTAKTHLKAESRSRLLSFARRGAAIPETRLKIGREVEKPNGYPFPGTYRGSVLTSKGEERVIVEHRDGWLHIFNPDQIAALKESSNAE
jgi:hypothetical protein